jgi:hypothetical protein
MLMLEACNNCNDTETCITLTFAILVALASGIQRCAPLRGYDVCSFKQRDRLPFKCCTLLEMGHCHAD